MKKRGRPILYSAHIDTGYFIFHTRALDSDREMIVLLTDKLLATSYLNWIVEERIQNKDAIYQVLNDFGVCHIVLEGKFSKSPSISWLYEEVGKGENFILKETIPIQSNDERLQGLSLEIYEYTSCGPPSPDATLEMNLPLINRSIHVKFDKLVKSL